MAAINLIMGDMLVSAYFAVPLAVVGFGLIFGAWFGRARWTVLLGLVLAGGLGIASLAEADQFGDYRNGPSNVVWRPSSISELNAGYSQVFGDATLDLRFVDFTSSTSPISIDVSVDAGQLRILLPSNVDADITANVAAGDATVLSESWGGFDTETRRVRDNGPDGEGGGKLVIDARVDFGNLEVTR